MTVDVAHMFPRNDINRVTDVTEESVGVGASVSVAPDQALTVRKTGQMRACVVVRHPPFNERIAARISSPQSWRI